jgi:hypothetical protein
MMLLLFLSRPIKWSLVNVDWKCWCLCLWS